MPTVHFQFRRPQAPQVIDITPQPWWRGVGRKVASVLVLCVAVPVLWFVGGVLALLLIGVLLAGLTALVIWGSIQRWRLARQYRRQPAAPAGRAVQDADEI